MEATPTRLSRDNSAENALVKNGGPQLERCQTCACLFSHMFSLHLFFDRLFSTLTIFGERIYRDMWQAQLTLSLVRDGGLVLFADALFLVDLWLCYVGLHRAHDAAIR